MCGELTVSDNGTLSCDHGKLGIPIKKVKAIKTHSILVISLDGCPKRENLGKENHSGGRQKKQFCHT